MGSHAGAAWAVAPDEGAAGGDTLARVTAPRMNPPPGSSPEAAADSSGFTTTAPDTLAYPPVPEAAPAQVIGRVSVTGNTYTDSLRILRTFEVPPGMRYSKDAVARGLGKLFALGLFDDIGVDRVDRGNLVDLVIHVVERPRITKIEFVGNSKKDSEDLQKKIAIHVGEPHSAVAVQASIDSVLKVYREDGYSLAKVTAETDTTAGAYTLRFRVQEGEKVKITKVEFTGVTAIDKGKLAKAVKSKKKHWFGGGGVDVDKLKEDLGRLADYLHDHGYRDAAVTGYELKPGDTPKHMTLVFNVEQGPHYRVGNVTWSGNTVLTKAAVDRYWVPRLYEEYSHARIEKAQGQAYADYAEQGYLYVMVEPQETVRDSMVDVAFQVTEGQPSHVRLVAIRGNKATREKVIRREVEIHEGDRFQRSALVRSQADLMRLGFFEEVVPDFEPADSTDVDIVFRVKEKSVGTASAGAGYTGESGLTGFIELGHNNVLGKGQSLQLHLERGAKRSDYSINFTEPWFRDTPTLLGVSAFSFQRELDLYRENRRGGSVRVGRPLPKIAYSRGSIGYSLEDVRLDSLTILTLADRLALGSLPFGVTTRTSTVTTTFSRATTDHPLYPRRGTRLSLTDQFAGGAFGGAVNFHKHRLEERVYFRSVMHALTTMVRARVGILGTYTGQTTAVPTYERFRLGGGTTSDPLRGYDDYQVVPSKFSYLVTSSTGVIANIDSSGATRDTTYRTVTQRIRYPGGRYALTLTFEQQFAIVHPLHGVLFVDAGNTWDTWKEVQPLDLKVGAGIGFRMEIPLLGVVGLDYGYGFNRDDRPRAVAHFLIGQVSF